MPPAVAGYYAVLAVLLLHLKDVTNTCKRMRHSPTIRGNGGKLEEAEDFKCVFVVYCVLESK